MGPRILNFGSNQHLAGELYMHVDETGQKKFLKGKDMPHSGMLRFSFVTCPVYLIYKRDFMIGL